MSYSVAPSAGKALPAKAARKNRLLALGAVVGPVLFTAAWIILGFVSPGYTLWDTKIAPYSSTSQPISGLGMGSTAAYMNTAFVIAGLLIGLGLIGIFQTIGNSGSRRTGRWAFGLLSLSPLGLVLLGIFDLEAIMPHTLGFLLATSTPIISFIFMGAFLRAAPGGKGLGTWLLIASPLTLVLVVLFFSTFDPVASGNNQGYAGLTQRLLAVETQACFAAMGWYAVRLRS